MVTRIVTQVKVFDIKSREGVLADQGFAPIRIPGLVWQNDTPWESDEKCNELLQVAIEDWQRRRNENPWGTTDHEPKLDVHWKTIDIEEISG